MVVAADGRCVESSVYPAIVHNKAQLTYDAVADWLDGNTNSNHRSPEGIATLEKIDRIPGLQRQLRLQDQAATALRTRRHEAGALSFRTAELQPVVSADGEVVDVKARQQNRASFLIEDLMIASNQVTAAFLDRHGLPSVRRVVRDPERWERIVDLAATRGGRLPAQPDAMSLEGFLEEQQKTDPAHFTELSFSIIKLLGRGEYAVKFPGEDAPGHFGLAVRNYAHSTAPNRRYPDLLTQRLLKAAFAGEASPYSHEQLDALAKHCTEKENDANKVERFVKKCAAALVLMSRVGETFHATISGKNAEGTWVRLSHPPVEGRLNGQFKAMDVGHRLDVRLAYVNPEKGFIDFELPGGA
jgi:exoribonuclease-2